MKKKLNVSLWRQAVASDLHPTPLCCRQVLPLPTFCGDIGNIIGGGTSHPTASYPHRGRVYSCKNNAAGVNLNSAVQQQAARNAPPVPPPDPLSRKPAPKTTATTPTAATATATADGYGPTKHQQQGCDRTKNGASLSTVSPAPTRKTTWRSATTAVELPPQQQQKHPGEFYSDEGVNNRGQQREDRESISHHPPQGDHGNRSAPDGHRLPPCRITYSGRPEMDRWVLGGCWVYDSKDSVQRVSLFSLICSIFFAYSMRTAVFSCLPTL